MFRGRASLWRVGLVLALLGIAPAVMAAEVLTYTYDALGRLKASVSTGTVNNGVQATVDFDSAGNRTQFEVVGSGPPPVAQIVVVPLNGYTVIVIPED